MISVTTRCRPWIDKQFECQWYQLNFLFKIIQLSDVFGKLAGTFYRHYPPVSIQVMKGIPFTITP